MHAAVGQVNYKNVMKQYSLGPNGGILTAMNLFATRFDQVGVISNSCFASHCSLPISVDIDHWTVRLLQVIGLCQKPRDPQPKYVIVDTPGQIEIFTWSASGAIMTEAFASTFPTMVLYIIDTPRCQHPQTFMSNMLQACTSPGW